MEAVGKAAVTETVKAVSGRHTAYGEDARWDQGDYPLISHLGRINPCPSRGGGGVLVYMGLPL